MSPSDKYEKIVITSSGKVTRIETDGGLLKNKEIIDCSKQESDDSFSAGADSNAVESVKTAQKPQKEPTKEYKFPPLRLLQKGAGSGSTKDDIKRELQENADKLQ